MRKILNVILTIFILITSIGLITSLSACEYIPADFPSYQPSDTPDEKEELPEETEAAIEEDGRYNSKSDVALYLHTYNKLPCNYYLKDEFYDIKNTWTSENKISCGGDRFYNYEGLLPEASGRLYYECDIDYTGGSRNAKRIVYSNDGLIFYTDDHYASFVQLY